MRYAIILLVAVLSSCSSFKETHYFKDTLHPVPNYFKVDIKGWTLWTSSRYVSGYYDQGAVQAYFGELGQPAKGSFPFAKEKDGIVKSVDTTNIKNKELVLLLSTNSDAIANSITNLVKSKSVANSLSTLINKDEIKLSRALEIQLAKMDQQKSMFIAKIDSYLGFVGDSTLSDELVVKNLKQLVKEQIIERNVESTNLSDEIDDLRTAYYNKQ